jgi:ethanolamine utilization protein EutA (predicted chaperonin)
MMIQNTEELREYVLKLAADNENNPRTIVEYMLALLKRLEQASNIVVPTFQDIADLLRDAYTATYS